MYIYIYIYIHTYIHRVISILDLSTLLHSTKTDPYLHTHIRSRHTHTHTHTYIHIYTGKGIRGKPRNIKAHTYTHTHIHTCIHIHTGKRHTRQAPNIKAHTYIHTHTYIHIHTGRRHTRQASMCCRHITCLFGREYAHFKTALRQRTSNPPASFRRGYRAFAGKERAKSEQVWF